MIDPDSLNPLEVLAYLKQLGYRNITSTQLKEFMHDLRKLIRYEQEYGSITAVDESTCESVSPCSHEKTDESSIDSSDLCSNCIASKSESSCEMLTSTISSLTCTDTKRKKQTTLSQHTSRPQSSFIRPWRLQPTSKPPAVKTSLKSDPVQLYHKYKELWALQKVPGENRHSQLRWTIREKMLGQDPQPRPVSQASSECRSRSTSCKQ